MPALPPESSTVLPAGADRNLLTPPWLPRGRPADDPGRPRERFAAHAHEARAAGGGEPVDRALVTSLGLHDDSVARLMRDIGFRQGAPGWVWRGRRRAVPAAKGESPHFAALAELRRG